MIDSRTNKQIFTQIEDSGTSIICERCHMWRIMLLLLSVAAAIDHCDDSSGVWEGKRCDQKLSANITVDNTSFDLIVDESGCVSKECGMKPSHTRYFGTCGENLIVVYHDGWNETCTGEVGDGKMVLSCPDRDPMYFSRYDRS